MSKTMVAHLHLIWHQICKGLKIAVPPTPFKGAHTGRAGGRFSFPLGSHARNKISNVCMAPKEACNFLLNFILVSNNMRTHSLLASIRLQSNMAPSISPMTNAPGWAMLPFSPLLLRKERNFYRMSSAAMLGMRPFPPWLPRVWHWRSGGILELLPSRLLLIKKAPQVWPKSSEHPLPTTEVMLSALFELDGGLSLNAAQKATKFAQNAVRAQTKIVTAYLAGLNSNPWEGVLSHFICHCTLRLCSHIHFCIRCEIQVQCPSSRKVTAARDTLLCRLLPLD